MRQEEDDELTYQQLTHNYLNGCFTYKSNKIMRQLSDPNRSSRFVYPEYLLLRVAKLFHLNQFQLIFFSQILTEQEPCHESDSQIFFKSAQRIQTVESQYRSLYLYLVVIGYAVKYYLNQDINLYQHEIKRLIPDFNSVFQAWAKKYSNKVLRTNPKKLNTFYIEMMKNDDQEDTNFKNFNEIVQDLGYIGPAEFSDDENLEAVVDIGQTEENHSRRELIKEEVMDDPLLKD